MLLFMKSTLRIINARGATDNFFGKAQFYRDLWKMSSHILAPLLELVRVDKKKLDWTDVPQKALENIEKVMSKETILNYQQELLNIVKILKETRNILLGQRIQVFIDYKNLVHELEVKGHSQRVVK